APDTGRAGHPAAPHPAGGRGTLRRAAVGGTAIPPSGSAVCREGWAASPYGHGGPVATAPLGWEAVTHEGASRASAGGGRPHSDVRPPALGPASYGRGGATAPPPRAGAPPPFSRPPAPPGPPPAGPPPP